MHSISLEKIYKTARIVIFAVPIFVISLGMYLVLFPIESFGYLAGQKENSKFEIEKNETLNEISFGVFPTMNHQYIDLTIDPGNSGNNCQDSPPIVTLEKTYRAFLYPDGEPINNKDTLKKYLFLGNNSRYPNGSLLHLKPTDEVYFLTNGRKILFPGPEIFRAFGYSFENLADVEKSSLDQFPDADNRIFLWTRPHPDGTILQAYPSHKIYLISNGKKHEIENLENLRDLWTNYYTIAVNDTGSSNQLICSSQNKEMWGEKIFCRFDRRQLLSELGGYYNFTLKYPSGCSVSDIDFKKGSVRLASEKSFATIKDSFRKIFTSIVNRYFLKQ